MPGKLGGLRALPPMSDTCGMSSVRVEQEVSDELAESNLACVRQLFAQLSTAAEKRGRSARVIAQLMGLDEQTVESALAGEMDLTLSDLQELALAVGAHVGYHVQADVDQAFDRIRVATPEAVLASWDDEAEADFDLEAQVKRVLEEKVRSTHA